MENFENIIRKIESISNYYIFDIQSNSFILTSQIADHTDFFEELDRVTLTLKKHMVNYLLNGDFSITIENKSK